MKKIDGSEIERLCRELCIVDKVDPDKTCYGMGIAMEAGSEYPAWHYNLKKVKLILDYLGIEYTDDWWNNDKTNG